MSQGRQLLRQDRSAAGGGP